MMGSSTHVIFGTGPVGIALLKKLKQRGVQDIRMINRSGHVQGIDQIQVKVIRAASNGT